MTKLKTPSGQSANVTIAVPLWLYDMLTAEMQASGKSRMAVCRDHICKSMGCRMVEPGEIGQTVLLSKTAPRKRSDGAPVFAPAFVAAIRELHDKKKNTVAQIASMSGLTRADVERIIGGWNG